VSIDIEFPDSRTSTISAFVFGIAGDLVFKNDNVVLRQGSVLVQHRPILSRNIVLELGVFCGTGCSFFQQLIENTKNGAERGFVSSPE